MRIVLVCLRNLIFSDTVISKPMKQSARRPLEFLVCLSVSLRLLSQVRRTSMMEFWLISVPLDKISCQSLEKLKRVAAKSGLATSTRFNVPELKVRKHSSSSTSLWRISDDSLYASLRVMVESPLTKNILLTFTLSSKNVISECTLNVQNVQFFKCYVNLLIYNVALIMGTLLFNFFIIILKQLVTFKKQLKRLRKNNSPNGGQWKQWKNKLNVHS